MSGVTERINIITSGNNSEDPADHSMDPRCHFIYPGKYYPNSVQQE